MTNQKPISKQLLILSKRIKRIKPTFSVAQCNIAAVRVETARARDGLLTSDAAANTYCDVRHTGGMLALAEACRLFEEGLVTVEAMDPDRGAGPDTIASPTQKLSPLLR
ncbi:hypothetical protein MCNS_43120 [Mycobacterium conspicuum]|uniref:Uncharacterized protein n=1 Tax=Mycobacterium conspicuum TaxID=44010 RepID=A0A7I7YHW3_9MYCO|nr:hypothetical protein MCNS_43120 [Mycobacterium conspicuum]